MKNVRVRSRSQAGSQAPERVQSRFRAAMGLLLMGLFLASSLVQAEAGSDSSLIDLNRATAEELTSLPGIGEAKAAAIVEYRNTSGAFTSIEDLEAVRGIGPAMVAKLRPHLTLGASAKGKSPSQRAEKSRPSAAK